MHLHISAEAKCIQILAVNEEIPGKSEEYWIASFNDFDTAVSLLPEHVEALLGRAKANLALVQNTSSTGNEPSVSSLVEVMADYDEVLRLAPDEIEARIGKAEAKYALSKSGDDIGSQDWIAGLESILVDYDEALRLAPDNAEIYAVRGEIRLSLGRYEEAVVDFDQMVRLEPDYIGGYAGRGFAKQAMGRFAEAITDYDEALLRNPENIAILLNHGSANNGLGQYQAALDDYDGALRLLLGNGTNVTDWFPEFLQSEWQLRHEISAGLNGRGFAMLALGMYEASLDDFENSQLVQPLNLPSLRGRGTSLLALGQYEAAKVDFDTYLLKMSSVGSDEGQVSITDIVVGDLYDIGETDSAISEVLVGRGFALLVIGPISSSTA